ncbi:hypothetical protein ABPG75_006504 [Micractinium tetrahymenae]
MEERYNFCIDMLSQPPEYLHSIIWEDESSVPYDPQPQKVIGQRGKEILITDPRKHTDKRHVPYIHYALAVCWAAGLLDFRILSYTKGYDCPIEYHVSDP